MRGLAVAVVVLGLAVGIPAAVAGAGSVVIRPVGDFLSQSAGDARYVALAGSTMTGQIRDTVQFLDAGNPDAGQSVTLSFSSSTAGLKVVTIHKALTINATAIASGSSARLKVKNGEPDAGLAITPPTGVVWIGGAAPSTIAAGKQAALSCDYCGSADAGACMCAWSAQP